jgi:hypothetical protein
MKQMKAVAKIIAKLLMQTGDKPSDGVEFLRHVQACVKIALGISGEILSVFGVETQFRTRGIDSALSNEITEEIIQEESSK